MLYQQFSQLYDLFGNNQKIFVAINQQTNIGVIPLVLQKFSAIFEIQNFATFYAIFSIISLCKFYKNKTKEYFETTYKHFVQIGIIYIIFGCCYALMKFTFNMPRPYCSLPQNLFKSIADYATVRCLSSFPSAHTGLAIISAYALWPYVGRMLKILLILFVLLIAISRITLAMHYPSDIIFSVLMCIWIVKMGKYIFRILEKNLIQSLRDRIYSIIARYMNTRLY